MKRIRWFNVLVALLLVVLAELALVLGRVGINSPRQYAGWGVSVLLFMIAVQIPTGTGGKD